MAVFGADTAGYRSNGGGACNADYSGDAVSLIGKVARGRLSMKPPWLSIAATLCLAPIQA